MVTIQQQPLRVLRRTSLEEKIGLARSTIYSKIDPTSKEYDSTFPTPIRIGNGKAVGWIECEIDAWIVVQVAKSRQELRIENKSRLKKTCALKKAVIVMTADQKNSGMAAGSR